MKKKIILTILMLVVLVGATITYLHFKGNIYTISINSEYIGKQENFTFENVNITYSNDSIVENTSNQVEKDELILQFQGKNKGSTDINIEYTYGGVKYTEPLTLTTGMLGIVYGYNDVNDFCGGESITVALGILMMIIAITCARTIKREIKNGRYTYSFINRVAMLILSVGVTIICINNFISFLNTPYIEYRGLYPVYESISTGAATAVFLSFPLFVVFSIAMIISNISLLKHEGKSFTNLLGIIISILIIIGYIIFYIMDEGNNNKIHIILATLYNTIFFFCESIFIGTIVVGLAVSKRKAKYNKDFIIINGCAIAKDGTPLPLLKGRVDKAIEFYNAQKEETGKEAIIIPSGGQGSDECISEAESMKQYMMKQGIPEKNIIKEDKSTTTYQNMKFSKKIIDETNKEGKAVFVTTNYHVFRAGLYADEVKLNAVGIGSKTKWYFWPNAFIREFIGMLAHNKIKLIIELGLIVGFMITMQMLTIG